MNPPASVGFNLGNGFRVWYRLNNPTEMLLTSIDPDFTDENDARHGLWNTYSGLNIPSANYHPNNYNRCRNFLSKQDSVMNYLDLHDLQLPPLVPDHSRRLRARPGLIKKYGQH